MRRSEVLVECRRPKNEGAVYLNNEDRKELKQWSFGSFTHCKKLKLRNLGIEKIGSGAFLYLEELGFM